MRDYPFSFEQLNTFSKSMPYGVHLNESTSELYKLLKEKELVFNFPAIRDDIGKFINFLFTWIKPITIFEFGSGYGQSCFWYLLNNKDIKNVILTEKRNDMKPIYESLPWPDSWKEKIQYHNEDAFEVFKKIETVDFVLIDGVKADYLSFLKECETKLSPNGLVLIDNSYWRGSFLDPELVNTKLTAMKIKELHSYISTSNFWESVFIPFEDGVSLLRPKQKLL